MTENTFHQQRLGQANLTPAQREILCEFLAHNVGNALSALVMALDVARATGAPASEISGALIDESIRRVRWTIEQVREPSAISHQPSAEKGGTDGI